MKKIITTIIGFALLGAPAFALAETATVSADSDTTVTARPAALQVKTEARATTTAERKDTAEARRAELIAKAKERADKEIERRIAGLMKLTARIGNMKRITDDNQSSLRAMVDTELGSLASLKTDIENETDVSALRERIQSIHKSYRIFALVIPQGAIIASADRVLAIATQMEQFSVKLSARLDTAAAAGTDVTAAKTALADFNAKVADAKVKAQAAIDVVKALVPDNGDKTVMEANMKALRDARAKVQAAQKDLKAAREDAGAIVRAIRALAPKTDASAETNASATTETNVGAQ